MIDKQYVALLVGIAAALLASSGSATPSSKGCEFDKTINNERIGPVIIGRRLDAATPPLHLEVVYLPYSDEDGEMATDCNGEVEVIFNRDQDGEVVSISTRSGYFETSAGARVGDNLEKILSMHPDGRVTSGTEEGGWVAYFPSSGRGYFEFAVEGLDHQCLQDIANCEVSKESLVSIRYWVIE